jgi:hypothetical protein
VVKRAKPTSAVAPPLIDGSDETADAKSVCELAERLTRQLADEELDLDLLLREINSRLGPQGTRQLRVLLAANVAAYLHNPDTVAWAAEHVAPYELSRALLAALPRSSGDERWDELIGPFYMWKGAVARLAGISTRAGLDRRRARHRVLGCQAGDGTWLYPVFQFADGDVLPGLSDLLGLLVPATDGWTAALWLRTPNVWLDRATPVERLVDDRDLVVFAADRQAREWSGDEDDLPAKARA